MTIMTTSLVYAADQAAFLLAQAAPAVPVTPAIPVEPNTVVVPYGAYIDTALNILLYGVGVAVAWGFRWLPSQIQALALTMRVDQLLIRSITYGINGVQGATRDKVLSFEVGNKVLREALTYAIIHGGSLVKDFMGSDVEVAQKIWSRLNVAESAPKPNFQDIASISAADAAISKAKIVS